VAPPEQQLAQQVVVQQVVGLGRVVSQKKQPGLLLHLLQHAPLLGLFH
jgi:hypothetical protein